MFLDHLHLSIVPFPSPFSYLGSWENSSPAATNHNSRPSINMFPQGARRGRRNLVRPGRPPHARPPGQLDWYNAAQSLLPTLMESRLKSWGPADVNIQQDCLFYNGRIPPEITDLIFEFALSPDTIPGPVSELHPNHDFCVRYDHERSSDEPEPEPATQQAEDVGTSMSTSLQVASQADGDLDIDGYITHPEASPIYRRSDLGFDWFRPDNTGRVVFNGHELLRTCRRVYLHTNKLLEQARDVIVYSGREPSSDWGLNHFISRLQLNYSQQLPKIHSIRWFAQMYLLVSLFFFPSLLHLSLALVTG